MKNQKKELRQFGFILTLILFFFSWRFLLKDKNTLNLIFFYSATFVFILSILTPLMLKLPQRILLFISHYIGWVNTRIILSIIYYFIFTPMAIFFRIIGKDFLERRLNDKGSSYWIARKEIELKKESYERQF